MHTEGDLAPTTAAAARDAFAALETPARTVTREVARAVLEPEAFDDRLTDDVERRAQEALFASRLAVHVGDRQDFDDWLVAQENEYEVVELGSDNVTGVAWHAAPFAETVVAATFSSEPDAAVETLRRQAVGRLYDEVV